jgi:hypothetical protein
MAESGLGALTAALGLRMHSNTACKYFSSAHRFVQPSCGEPEGTMPKKTTEERWLRSLTISSIKLA